MTHFFTHDPFTTQTTQIGQRHLAYLLKGSQPILCILIGKGEHSDQLSESITALVKELHHQLPEAVLVPKLPESLFKKLPGLSTQKIDEVLTAESLGEDPELELLTKVVATHEPFKVLVEFHESSDLQEVTADDYGQHIADVNYHIWSREIEQLKLKSVVHKLSSSAVELLQFWAVRLQLTPRAVVIRMPTHLTAQQKREVVKITIDHLILPSFR